MTNQAMARSTFSLLNADYVRLNKNWNYRNVISPFYRLYLIDGGSGKLYQAENTVMLEENYLYLIPSFTTCNYFCPAFLSQYYLHFLEEAPDGTSLFASNQKILKVRASPSDFDLFARLLTLNPGRELKQSYNPKDYQKEPVMQRSQDLNNTVPIAAFLETRGILLQLLSRFLTPDQYHPTAVKTIPSKILETINYIATNLDAQLTVAHLAERVCQHADYFSRVFQDHTGQRPLAYIQTKRIERAQFLMLTTDLSYHEIATETGFESLSYFSRIFKSVTGQAPRYYSKNNQTI